MSFDYLPRQMKYGQNGTDIFALERCLHEMNIRPDGQKCDGHFGRRTRDQVKKLQRNHNLTHDGVVGPKTSHVLQPHYDGYGKYLILKWDKHHPPKPTLTVRQRIVKAALYGVAQNGVIHYTQDSRRMQDFGPPPNVPNYTDCSGFATWCYKVAGAPDPNGLHFNGTGYTGTMLNHGRRVGNPQPGDLVFCFSPVSHVCVYIGGGRCVSHGHEGYPDDPRVVGLFAVNQIRSYV